MHASRLPLAGLLPLLLSAVAFAEGVVTVAPQGKDLTLRGDAAGNDITILPGDAPSQLRIIPSNGTTLNGFELPIDFDTPERTLDIRLDGGDDTIVIAGGVDAGDLVVVFGTGSNSLAITGSRFDDISVEGSDNADQVTLVDSAVEGNLVLDLLGGADLVTLAGTTAVGRKTTLELGAGNDVLDVDSTNFGKRVKVDFGDGADQLTALLPIFRKAVSVRFGPGGLDDVFLDLPTFLKKPKLNGSDDPLTVTVRNGSFVKGANLRCGDAADSVVVTGTTADKPLTLHTGDGHDEITFTGNQSTKKAKLLGGDGDDGFEVSGNTFQKGALVHGGRDTDTQRNDIAADNTVVGGKLKLKSVEIAE